MWPPRCRPLAASSAGLAETQLAERLPSCGTLFCDTNWSCFPGDAGHYAPYVDLTFLMNKYEVVEARRLIRTIASS
jgi:hypothetical protein